MKKNHNDAQKNKIKALAAKPKLCCETTVFNPTVRLHEQLSGRTIPSPVFLLHPPILR